MDKVIFACKYFQVKAKHAILFGIMFVCLLIMLKACKQQDNKQIERKKEETIADMCGFTRVNLNDINRLLSRADLCSEQWYKDLAAYIKRIEDQNEKLINKSDKKYQDVYKLQIELLQQLKNFENAQSDTTLHKLQESLKTYKAYYDKTCDAGEGR